MWKKGSFKQQRIYWEFTLRDSFKKIKHPSVQILWILISIVFNKEIFTAISASSWYILPQVLHVLFNKILNFFNKIFCTYVHNNLFICETVDTFSFFHPFSTYCFSRKRRDGKCWMGKKKSSNWMNCQLLSREKSSSESKREISIYSRSEI